MKADKKRRMKRSPAMMGLFSNIADGVIMKMAIIKNPHSWAKG